MRQRLLQKIGSACFTIHRFLFFGILDLDDDDGQIGACFGHGYHCTFMVFP